MSGAPQGLRPPDAAALREAVARALAEDRVSQDVTTLATVPPEQSGRGSLLIKQDGVLCGLDTVREVYCQLGGGVAVEALAADGDAVRSVARSRRPSPGRSRRCSPASGSRSTSCSG